MDEQRYGDLLKEIRPRIIDNAEEHERLLSAAEALMEKGDTLSVEEHDALALLVLIIEAFESNAAEEDGGEEEDEECPSPHLTLQRLMESRGLGVDDVSSVFGNPRLTHEVLEGRRSISRGQAKELGKLFHVPPKLFQE